MPTIARLGEQMSEQPQKLGKYEIRRELGRGAMGIVYEGYDAMIDRHVALKTVRKDQLERGEAEEMLSRFRREAQAAGRLNHPNVVSVYEYGEEPDGTAFIAMEYVEGRELKEYFDQQERFPLAEIVRLMRELLGALGHAHAHGIVHRDIKPANIFIVKDGRAKVGDFGIARIESSNLTQAGSVLGTPAYMSPEQFMGQRVDQRSDLFSAGVILYQFLSGEKPFAGQLTTIMHKVLKEDPIAPSELNVQAPRAFDQVVRKAMAKRPEDRFQNAKEFSDALQAALDNPTQPGEDATVVGGPIEDATVVHGGADATLAYQAPAQAVAPPSVSTARPAVPTSPASPVAPVIAAATAAPRRTPIAAIVAGIGAVVVLGAGGAYLMLNKGGSSAPVAVDAGSAITVPGSMTADSSPKTITISAVAYADPSDPRFAADPNLLRTTLREETRRELIEKAVGLYVQPNSLSQNYAVLREKLLARSGDFIETMVQEDAPLTNKEGLTSMSAKATVKVRDVQKSLNQMSREDRIDFIRNNGDPKISVSITTQSAAEGAQPKRSQIAENVLKERVQSFGFRTWAEEAGDKKSDFAVLGEAKFKKLSVKLEASGLQLERTVITSWTIKCIDKKTGEEIYFNTTIPQKLSWNSEDEALADLGKLIGEEFSKSFFLQNFHFIGQKVRLNVTGLPDDSFAKRLLNELNGLRSILTVKAVSTGSDAKYDIDVSGGLVNASDLISGNVAMPLNRKFGRSCFNVNSSSGNEVNLSFDPACKDPAVTGRLDTAPPASMYEAPPAKRQAIVRDPAMLKKLEI